MSLSARGPAECGAGDLLLAGPRPRQRLSRGGGGRVVLYGAGVGGKVGWRGGSLKCANKRRPEWGVAGGKAEGMVAV